MSYINGNQYSYSHISVNFLGKTVAELTLIEYELDREIGYVGGSGDEPQGIQRGVKKYPVKIGLLQSAVEQLEEVARIANPSNPSADISDLTFDIICSYADGLKINTDRLKNCVFGKYGKGMKKGDLYMDKTMDGLALAIERGV